MCQLETPVEATIEALTSFKGLSILNAAPAISNLPECAFKQPTIFCVNELEAEELTNIPFKNIGDAKKIIQSLTTQKGCKTVIVTLGKHGAAFNDNDKIYHVPILSDDIQSVDSTGMCVCVCRDENEIKHISVLNYMYLMYIFFSPSITMMIGAGDAFCGGLAYFLAKFPHASLLQQVAASISIATHSVQYKGTQSSYKNFPSIDPTTLNSFEYHEL